MAAFGTIRFNAATRSAVDYRTATSPPVHMEFIAALVLYKYTFAEAAI